jgi:glyoxylase-like metal-dependent hydrolase (beta-lactamase superfamily II)
MLLRRQFVFLIGRGSLGVALLGTVACRSTGDTQAPASTGSTAPSSDRTSTTAAVSTTSAAVADRAWERVDLGFVSAYVLVRAGEAAVIDTGSEGSAGAIEGALSALGAGWEGVSNVILTHSHGDHVGSLDAVLAAAESATPSAGEPDIAAIRSSRPITALAEGDAVFGLEVIATPGHTPGHISLLDPDLRILFAGDALNGGDGVVLGPNPEFTPDMDTAMSSVGKLAGFDYDLIVFGHGDPVGDRPVDQVAGLAAGA